MKTKPSIRPEAVANQSKVYEAFREDEKLTITDIVTRFEGKLSDQTVRRSIKALVSAGHLKSFGKQNNATLYGKLSASFAVNKDAPDEVVPFGKDNLLTIEDFVRIVADPDSRPLQVQIPMLGEKAQHHIRRRLLYVILTTTEGGTDEALKKILAQLEAFRIEAEFVQNILTSFVLGPVWYAQYRDQLAYGVRRLQEKDPELYQLAVEYMKAD